MSATAATPATLDSIQRLIAELSTHTIGQDPSGAFKDDDNAIYNVLTSNPNNVIERLEKIFRTLSDTSDHNSVLSVLFYLVAKLDAVSKDVADVKSKVGAGSSQSDIVDALKLAGPILAAAL